MKRTLRWSWPALVVGLAVVVPWIAWHARPARPLAVAVVDKTVPFSVRVEHRSLFWLLDHLKVVKPGGAPYDPDRDYVGAFPGPRPGDPPARTTELDAETAVRARLVYLADTYGVYRDDLASGAAMKAALERSPKIYGGLTLDEARAAVRALEAGRTVVAEFNSIGSPTPEDARAILEEAFGVRWTRWIGRYFERLDDPEEVPQWLRRDYEREWGRPWDFTGPGYALVQDDARVEVLRVGVESQPVGLELDRETPADRVLAAAGDGVPYPYWFDVVEARPGAEVLASFRWDLSPDGEGRLRARGLPLRFPAVVRNRVAGRGPAYYFSGDFADNPMDSGRIPFAGYLTFRRAIERARIAPSKDAFYWRFYAPMMAAILDDAAL